MVTMRILFVTKRHYSHQDLINDRFGRLFHLPVALAAAGHRVAVIAIDYQGSMASTTEIEGVAFTSVPLRGAAVFSCLAAAEIGGGRVRARSSCREYGHPPCWLADRLARRRKPLLSSISTTTIELLRQRGSRYEGPIPALLRRSSLVTASVSADRVANRDAAYVVQIANGSISQSSSRCTR